MFKTRKITAAVAAIALAAGLTVATAAPASAYCNPKINGTACGIYPAHMGKWGATSPDRQFALWSPTYGWAYLPAGYTADRSWSWTYINVYPGQCIAFDKPAGGVNRSTAYTICNDRRESIVVPFGDQYPGIWGLWTLPNLF